MTSEFTQGWQSNNSYRHDKREAESAGETLRVIGMGLLLWGALLILWPITLIVMEPGRDIYWPVVMWTIIAGVICSIVAWPLLRASRLKHREAMTAFNTKWAETLERIDE